jgi:hypothetical protein
MRASHAFAVVLAKAATNARVVPAKAGTHNHREQLLRELVEAWLKT